jgi:Fur family peroxide stress response transcriptional regulator
MVDRLSEIVTQLRNAGTRVTPQRVAIIQALLDQDHPTVEGILARLQPDFPMTSVATVYRTLLLLQEMGILLEVNAGGPLSHYDGYRPVPHAHMVCTVCGRVVDAPEVDLDALADDLGQRTGTDQRPGHWRIGSNALFFGVCPDCQHAADDA